MVGHIKFKSLAKTQRFQEMMLKVCYFNLTWVSVPLALSLWDVCKDYASLHDDYFRWPQSLVTKLMQMKMVVMQGR